MKKKFLFLAILVIILAAIPRVVELLAGNYLWGFDQGEFFLDVKNIVVNHKFTLIGVQVGGQGGFFQGAGWNYLLAIPFAIFMGNPYGAMVLMFMIGIATVLFSIIFVKKMFGEETALLVGFFIAVSLSVIPQSRFIWPPFPISLLSVFFLFFFYKLLKGKKAYLALIACTLGLMTHFETATAATLLLQFLVFTPVLFWKKLISWRSSLLAIILFIIPLLPLAFFDMRHHFLIFHGLTRYYSSPHIVQLKAPTYQSVVINHVDVFVSTFASLFPYIGSYWVLIGICMVIGTFFYIKDTKILFEKKIFVLYLALSSFLLFAVFMLYKWPMWNWWILEIPIFTLFLLGILLSYFSKTYLWGKFLLFIIIVYFGVSYGIYTVHAYNGDYKDYGGTAKIKGKIDAIDFIYKDAHGKPFGLLIFTPPVYTYAYDYLLWWYGQKTYHYVPYTEKKGTFYLLMEKDPEKPYSYNGWIDTVVKTGKVVSTKTLQSGFIVQKRIAK